MRYFITKPTDQQEELLPSSSSNIINKEKKILSFFLPKI